VAINKSTITVVALFVRICLTAVPRASTTYTPDSAAKHFIRYKMYSVMDFGKLDNTIMMNVADSCRGKPAESSHCFSLPT